MRGRVRLRVPYRYAPEAALMAARLSHASGVEDVRWSPRSRSLVVRFARDLTFEDVLERLPDKPRGPAMRPKLESETSSQPWWRIIVRPAVALGAGLVGVNPIAGAVLAAAALPIGERALKAVRGGKLSIDVLDAGAVSLLIGTGDLLAAGVSVALIESGERLRRQASGRARRVIRHWMGGDERGVRLQRKGTEPRVPLNTVALGDRAVVYAGETIPVDGRVVSGSGSVDNRTWTGEPYPVVTQPGDSVLAGATLLDGRVVIEITAVGEATRAGRLAAAIEEALAANTPTTDAARRIADRFVGPVLLGSGLAYALTGDIARVVSMLIVDFGTGIRIGIPTSFLATMIAGARAQVLFKNGTAIERLASVDTIVFDKTGTLTQGRPAVIGVDPAPGFDRLEVLRLAAAAEGHLPHPMAGAIRKYARSLHLELPEATRVTVSAGGGVDAVVDGLPVRVGTRDYLARSGIALPELAGTDASIALVAINGQHAASIRMHDGVRDEARAVIEELRSLHLTQLLLATGDRRTVAKGVATTLGLDDSEGRLMPEDKVSLVRDLQARGHRVALVGDGINDAAAMAEATVGIAVADGADLARESADVVLGGQDLRILVDAVQLARLTMRLVRQDIALVAAPNALALAAATMGRLTPLAATVVNNGSTLLTGANSLRPLRYRSVRVESDG